MTFSVVRSRVSSAPENCQATLWRTCQLGVGQGVVDLPALIGGDDHAAAAQATGR
jgi:hypothetical protein